MLARRYAFDLSFREKGIRNLHELTTNPSSLEEAVQKCLQLGCLMFDCEMGMLTEFKNDQFTIRSTRAPKDLQPRLGSIANLEPSCFQHGLTTKSPVFTSRLNQKASFEFIDRTKTINQTQDLSKEFPIIFM